MRCPRSSIRSTRRAGASAGAGTCPWILGTAIPRLHDDPDAFFDATCRFLDARPAASAPEHAVALFEWWAARIGRPIWIERSGAAIDYMGALDAHFPDAHFLHIHRQGEEAALSMRGHHAFRLAIMLANRLEPDPGLAGGTAGAASAPEDRISRLLESRPRAELFGKWWNDQVARGVARPRCAPARTLLRDPLRGSPGASGGDARRRRALPRIARSRRRLAPGRRTALVKPPPAPRLLDLAPADADALVRACADGNAALAGAHRRRRVSMRAMSRGGYEHLLAPGRIGPMECRNRIAMTPMGTNQERTDGFLGEGILSYYEARARGAVRVSSSPASPRSPGRTAPATRTRARSPTIASCRTGRTSPRAATGTARRRRSSSNTRPRSRRRTSRRGGRCGFPPSRGRSPSATCSPTSRRRNARWRPRRSRHPAPGATTA